MTGAATSFNAKRWCIRIEVWAKCPDRQIRLYAYWTQGVSTASLMRHAVMAPCFGTSMAETTTGGIAVARRLHICAPLVAKAGGCDGVVVFGPKRACKALNLRREITRLGDMDAQFSAE